MVLLDIVKSHRGAAAKLACATGLSRPFIWQCATGDRRLPAAHCAAIERATGGKVVVDQLRADVHWHRVPDPTWPHPDGRPTIDVAAPKVEVRDAA